MGVSAGSMVLAPNLGEGFARWREAITSSNHKLSFNCTAAAGYQMAIRRGRERGDECTTADTTRVLVEP